MFFWRSNRRPKGEIYDWLLANKKQIRAGTAQYMGTPVNDATEFFQYKYVISLGVTLIFTTRHFLPTSANSYLRSVPRDYTLLSLLLGWWCFPWGPLFTIHAALFNIRSHGRRTAASLLELLERGWDSPYGVSRSAYRKQILAVSDRAAVEIRARRTAAGFSEDLAVRITPVRGGNNPIKITFDYPVSDGRDWTDESQGLLLLIDKDHEADLCGCVLDYHDGRFLAAPSAKPPAST